MPTRKNGKAHSEWYNELVFYAVTIPGSRRLKTRHSTTSSNFQLPSHIVIHGHMIALSPSHLSLRAKEHARGEICPDMGRDN